MKKNLKKLAAIAIAAVMMISVFPLSAFAEEESQSVQARTTGIDPYSSVSASEAVIDVSVEWGDLNFVYNFGTIWNPTTHSYDAAEGETLGWNKTSTDVTVTNNSNVDVDVNVRFDKTDSDAFSSVNASFDKSYTYLSSATDGSSHSDTFTLGISGIPSKACYEPAEFGIITVSFAAAFEEPAGVAEVEQSTDELTDEPTDEPTDESYEYYYWGCHDGDDNDT